MFTTELSPQMSSGDGVPNAAFPFISVIVPTYNRAGELPYLFAALAAQWYPADRTELIVVDNSSTDDTESVVACWSRSLPFRVSFYIKENNGPAASRNYGAARARGDILAFTDSDCVPLPGWLRGAADAFVHGAKMVLGPFYPVGRESEPLLVAQQSAQDKDKGCYPTANLFILRIDWEAIGGFDERYGLYPWGGLVAGEDTDLAWRIRRTGVNPVFREDAAVGHLSTPITFRRLLLRPMIVAVLPALLRRIPELRQTFFWRRYWISKYGFYFDLAVIAIAATALTHWWWLALLGLPWLRHILANVLWPTTRILGLRRAVLYAALHVYGQMAETLVLVGASLRYRRLVL